MKRLTLETRTHFHLLGCVDGVEFVDGGDDRGRRPRVARSGRDAGGGVAGPRPDLVGDREGLAEIGVEVLDSVSRAGLN